MVVFGGSAMAADAAYMAKSREIRGRQAPIGISVDVTNVEVLELVAIGYSWGQAVWCINSSMHKTCENKELR